MSHAGASPHWEKLWAQDGGLPKGTRFDVAGVARPLAAELSRRSKPRPGARALVPGCGRAYDALALARHGYTSVVAVDLSPAACEAAREELQASGGSAGGGGAWRVRYVGVVLDPTSVDALAAAVPPRHPNVTGQQHLTLCFEPAAAELAAALPLLGTRCTLRVEAEASDSRGQAVTVALASPELADSLGAITAGGSGRRDSPHITLSTADGVEACYSNELVRREGVLRPRAAAPLLVTGKVAVAVEPPPATATAEGRAAAKASRRIVADPTEAARLLLPPSGEGEAEAAAAAASSVDVVCADFFALDARVQYDLIWDCTFLCALEPAARGRWAEQMRALLAPGGELLTAVFPIGERDGGPPFAMSVPLVRSLLEPVGFEAAVVRDNLPHEEQHRRPSDELSSTVLLRYLATEWGDHCSIVSDTTCLAAAACQCSVFDHFKTQIPYAMYCGLSALLLGFLPTAYGMPAGVGIFFALSVAPAISIAISYIPGFGSLGTAGGAVPTYSPTSGEIGTGIWGIKASVMSYCKTPDQKVDAKAEARVTEAA